MNTSHQPLIQSASMRRGSFLLLVLALVLAMSIMAFAFVRMTQMSLGTGDSMNRQMLARDQAVSGANHALEVIMRDYIQEPFTRMDGPAHAAFQSEKLPYNVSGVVDGIAQPVSQIGFDDVPVEHPLFGPMLSTWWHGWNWLYMPYWYGELCWDGRGRYLEPGFYNRPSNAGFRPPGGGTPQQPVVPVRFGQSLTAADPLPDIDNAIFFDEHWHRILGNPRIARDQARYRVRYAVGVMDMEGMLLGNPDPSLDPSQIVAVDPRTYADPSLSRIVRAQHALPSMISAWTGYSGQINAGFTDGVRTEHVFIGRGYASNYNRLPAKHFAPSTFPGMYRTTDHPQIFKSWDFWGWNNGWPANPPELATTLFHTSDGVVTGLPEGGEVLKGGATFYHVLSGPQYSPMNFNWSVGGNNTELPFGNDGQVNYMGSISPFGRGLALGGRGRYGAHVDTPWCVNIMTAPPRVIYAMIAGYMPSGVIQAWWQPDLTWARNNQVSPKPAVTSYVLTTRDLFIAPLNTAFQSYPGPSSTSSSSVFPQVQPDYHVDAVVPTDPGYQPPGNRYPGEIGFNGYDSSGVLVSDTLGTYLCAAPGPLHVPGLARDPHTATSFWFYPNPGVNYWDSMCRNMPFKWDIDTNVPAQHDPRKVTDGTGYTGVSFQPSSNSIWDVIGRTFANTMAVARGQWMQYPNGFVDPATLFDGGPWTGARIASIKDIDALFLANLGIDIQNPSGTTPIRAWCGDPSSLALHSYIPNWTIASLMNEPGFAALAPTTSSVAANGPYTAEEKTQVMELIINDFRMSVFGSSPDYGDDFRPLDLNGDGKVACSAYPTSAHASSREKTLHIDQYAEDPAASTLMPTNYFCLTGNFRMGKSKYWEVVSRGEVWDNVLKNVISEATLDTALVIDPADAANEFSSSVAQKKPYAQYSSHVLFRRWYYDKYRALMSRDY